MTEEQLRKRVDKYMCNAVPGVNTLTGNLDGIMSLFTKQLELAKIEAKIEELNLAANRIKNGLKCDYYCQRLSKLTKQKDLLTKESK